MPTPDATLPSARAKQVFAVTLFVDDLDATEQFYHDVFGMPLIPSSPPVSGIPKIFSDGPWSANTRMISPNASVTIAM